MSRHESETYQAALELQDLMVARATSEPKIPVAEYQRLRSIVIADARVAQVVPRFVRSCHTPDAFWSYIRQVATGSGSWGARSAHIHEAFGPLLEAAENLATSPAQALVDVEVTKLDSAAVTAAWGKALERRERDPDGAITAARTLLESVCKTILEDLPRDPGDDWERDDLPKLYGRVARELNLSPQDHVDKELKRILSGCVNVVVGLGSVRNRVGDAHGGGRRAYRPAQRHAALAVNLAGAMALFLLQTSEGLRDYYEGMAKEALDEELAEWDEDEPAAPDYDYD